MTEADLHRRCEAAARAASLIGDCITDADLHGAYLTGAYLTGANLTGADLTDADLTGHSR